MIMSTNDKWIKNKYSLGLIGLIILAVPVSLSYQCLTESSPHGMKIFITGFLLVWITPLIVILVLYKRRANELRDAYWNAEHNQIILKNIYMRQIIFAFCT